MHIETKSQKIKAHINQTIFKVKAPRTEELPLKRQLTELGPRKVTLREGNGGKL